MRFNLKKGELKAYVEKEEDKSIKLHLQALNTPSTQIPQISQKNGVDRLKMANKKRYSYASHPTFHFLKTFPYNSTLAMIKGLRYLCFMHNQRNF